MELIQKLRATSLDKDNFPRMKSEKWLPVGLAQEAADEIERLRAALKEIKDRGEDMTELPIWAWKIAYDALEQKVP